MSPEPTSSYAASQLSTPANIAGRPLSLRLRLWRSGLWLCLAIVALVAVVPSLYLLVWATAGTETVGILDVKPSLTWFKRILRDPEWRESLFYSTVLGAFVSAAGALTLTTHFYFMRYVHPRWDRLAYVMVFLVATVPSIIYALALRFTGGQLRLSEVAMVAAGHFVFVVPVQFFILESAQERVPSDRLFAASTLGASHSSNIRFCYVPLMRQAIGVAFVVGFFVSFDELVIATFVIDTPLVTVPRRLWDQVHRSMTPAPAVMACLLGAVSIAGGALWAVGRRRRFAGRNH